MNLYWKLHVTGRLNGVCDNHFPRVGTGVILCYQDVQESSPTDQAHLS